MNSFTYTITSLDNTLGAASADNVKIQVNGFPTNYKYFKCRVSSFIINQGSFDNTFKPLSYIQLSCNNLGFQNITSGQKTTQIIASANLVDGTMTNSTGSFVIANPNTKTLEFQLLNQLFGATTAVINQNTATTIWTLTLELTPISDDPNNYQLRNGL
jgi:hypothetical protein